jgi:hypothetical protein
VVRRVGWWCGDGKLGWLPDFWFLLFHRLTFCASKKRGIKLVMSFNDFSSRLKLFSTKQTKLP